MRVRTASLTGGIVVAAAVLVVGGVLVGAGFRYWNALPAAAPSVEASTVAALAALALAIVLLIELQRSRANPESVDRWAIVGAAALAGVLVGLVNGPLPDNARAFSGTVRLEITSPIKAKFDAAGTVYCETVAGTDLVAWLAATSMEPVPTPKLETPTPSSSGLETAAPESPRPELPALNVYLTIGVNGQPTGISISTSPTNEPMTNFGASLELVAGDRSGRATFSALHTDEAWTGSEDGGDLAGSLRWTCSDRLPDEVVLPGG